MSSQAITPGCLNIVGFFTGFLGYLSWAADPRSCSASLRKACSDGCVPSTNKLHAQIYHHELGEGDGCKIPFVKGVERCPRKKGVQMGEVKSRGSGCNSQKGNWVRGVHRYVHVSGMHPVCKCIRFGCP